MTLTHDPSGQRPAASTNTTPPLKIAIISSIIPKRCGIATFGRDLLDGIKASNGEVEIYAIAAETGEESYEYALPVVATIKINDRSTYAAAGKVIASLKPDIVLLQHEFGLFGGAMAEVPVAGKINAYPTGDYIFDLLAEIDSPIITTLHTVLPHPDPQRKAVIARLGSLSKRLITMTTDSVHILVNDYGVPADVISMIPHGVTHVDSMPTKDAKEKLGIATDSAIMMISGLIGENKSVDVAIAAMPAILAKHPKVQLYIVGQTHPTILAHAGERYREALIQQAKDLGIADHVVFINKYLTLDELLGYLQCADIYLTLHKDPEQAASGTLAYALGAGLVAISTPYRYAKEVLADGRGMLVDFGSAADVAEATNTIFDSKIVYDELRRKAYTIGQSMSWPLIGKQYLEFIGHGQYSKA